MAKAQFAKVIFHREDDIFPLKRDIECPFEVTETLEVSTWDWVGLFKVGWRTQKDYVTYQYVSVPSDYQKGKKLFTTVTFPANTLPKDEEYYQFCYVSWGSGICGASFPLQFRDSSGKEYVEEESDDMMIIRDKKDVMQDEIQKLSHKLMLLTTERDDLQMQLEKAEKWMEMKDSMIIKLETQVSTLEQIEEHDREKIQDMQVEIDSFQIQMKTLKEEKDHAQKEIEKLHHKREDLQVQITSLKTNIRSLESEKDELSGQNQSLLDELNTYKMQVTESQTLATQSGKTIAKLNESLEAAYNECATVVEECEDLKKKGAEKDGILKKMDELVTQLVQEKAVMERQRDDLAQELNNAADKLSACETMKVRLSQDLEAYEITQRNMTDKFETQESGMRLMQEQLQQTSRESANTKKQLMAKIKELEEKSKVLSHTEATLNQTLVEAEKRLKDQQALGEQLARVEREHCETIKQLDVVMAQLKVVSDEKTALQMQLRTFEDELQETLVLKDKEVAAKLEELKEKTLLMEEKDHELAQKDERIKSLEDEVDDLSEQLQTESKRLHETREALASTQVSMSELQTSLDKCTHGESSREEEEDRDSVLDAQVEEQQEHQEEEASRYCLLIANETLKSRIEAKEKELETLKHTIKDIRFHLESERIARDEKEEEVEELKQRLELGKMEFKNKVLENQKLSRKLMKTRMHNMKRSPGSEASDTEPENKDRPIIRHQTTVLEYEEDLYDFCRERERAGELEIERDLLKKNSDMMKKTIAFLEESLKAKNEYIMELETRLSDQEGEGKEAVADGDSEVEEFEGEDQEQVSEGDGEVEEHEEDHEGDLEGEKHGEDQEQASEGEDQEDFYDEEEDLEEIYDEDHEESYDDLEWAKSEGVLMYGNPYHSKPEAAAESPMQQSIIRSTLEEEAESTSDPMSAAAGEGEQLPPPLQPEVVVAQGAAASADPDDWAAEEGAHDTFEDCLANMPATEKPGETGSSDDTKRLLTVNADERSVPQSFSNQIEPSRPSKNNVARWLSTKTRRLQQLISFVRRYLRQLILSVVRFLRTRFGRSNDAECLIEESVFDFSGLSMRLETRVVIGDVEQGAGR